jgi:hypothetical protein
MFNSISILTGNLPLRLLLTVGMLISFYYYAKRLIFRFSPTIALKTSSIQNYPFSQIVGVVKLSIVAICHVIFCASLVSVFKIDIYSIIKNTSILSCIYGVFIGIGSMGISFLLCSVGMRVCEIFAKQNTPSTLHGWMTVANAGWIRHHKHTLKILPAYLALLIITLQIGSEEIIFRAVLTDIFIPFGIVIAFCISTILFIYMQTLHMPSKTSAMFPVLGATVMGISHELIYLNDPSIIPLIISHLTFFIFTVI